MSLNNLKVAIINLLQNKPNTANTKKHPFKVKFYKIQEHDALRIPEILGVMFLFCPKSTS